MNEEDNTINYRLGKIEETLSDLKEVLIENKLQAKDISDLKNSLRELIDGINAHDKRLRQLETAPVKKDAEKWKTITDFIFKGILTVVGTIVLVKLGIKI
ncbi:MAG: hypothetical protein ACTTJ1_08090 [Treponema sp.]